MPTINRYVDISTVDREAKKIISIVTHRLSTVQQTLKKVKNLPLPLKWGTNILIRMISITSSLTSHYTTVKRCLLALISSLELSEMRRTMRK